MAINTQNLVNAITNYRQLLRNRLDAHFKKEEKELAAVFPTIQLADDGSALHRYLSQHRFTIEEYITLMTALAPHIQPAFFENMIQEFLPNGGEFPEFGGVKAGNNRCILPTGETVLFILAGVDLPARLQLQELFSQEHTFFKERILWLEDVKEGEPVISGRLVLSQEFVELFLFNKVLQPKFSQEFPAKKLSSQMEWNDLILHPQTAEQIGDIRIWLQHNQALLQDYNIARKLKPGYRALFYGPPGTGKTLTATLLGKEFNKEVYRVDLSQVVSKYIGETEKNLEKVFSKAENKDWILFFDEADALFGKRTNVSNSHDRFANQEVSYLLQRVEDFPGLLILASNFKSNLDKAFTRRFHNMIHFPMPTAGERLEIWNKTFPGMITLSPDIDLNFIAQKFELSGASILNIVQFASLRAISNQQMSINQQDLLTGIKREFWKDEKTI
ncbi:MAG: ATP-binding protein [Chitinophagaceae bacterium]